MKVDIEHEEITRGMLRKKTYYKIKCNVQFSEEEKAIIKEGDLDGVIVMERPPSADIKVSANDEAEWFYLRIGALNNDKWDEFCVDTKSDIAIYEEELKGSLKQLKTYLEANGNTDTSSKSFEL